MHGRATFHAADAPDDLFGSARLFCLIDQLAIRLPVLAPLRHAAGRWICPFIVCRLNRSTRAQNDAFDPSARSASISCCSSEAVFSPYQGVPLLCAAHPGGPRSAEKATSLT